MPATVYEHANVMHVVYTLQQAQKASTTGRQHAQVAAVLAVLVLAVAVQATDNQLPHIKAPQLPWEKLPFVSRFSKAAQAAKAAAAAITVSHTLPKTPSLPPAAPVAAAPAHQPPAAAAGTTAGAGVPNAPAPNPPADAGKKGKKAKELKQLPTTGKNETQAGCSCLTDWESKPGGTKLSGCANPDNDPLVSCLACAQKTSNVDEPCTGVDRGGWHMYVASCVPADSYTQHSCAACNVKQQLAASGLQCITRCLRQCPCMHGLAA